MLLSVRYLLLLKRVVAGAELELVARDLHEQGRFWAAEMDRASERAIEAVHACDVEAFQLAEDQRRVACAHWKNEYATPAVELAVKRLKIN